MDYPVEELLRDLRDADHRTSSATGDREGLTRPWRVRSFREWTEGPAPTARGFSRTEQLIAGPSEQAVDVARLFLENGFGKGYVVTRLDLAEDAPWRLVRVVQATLRAREVADEMAARRPGAAADGARLDDAYVPGRRWQLGVPSTSIDDESDPGVDDWRVRRCDVIDHPDGIHYHPTNVNGKWRTYRKQAPRAIAAGGPPPPPGERD